MFTASQTAILEFLLKHSVVSPDRIKQVFANAPDLVDDIYELEELGVIEWFENKYNEGYQVAPRWSKLLKNHFYIRDELARVDAEKESARRIRLEKSERFKLPYSIVVSVIIVLIVSAISAVKNGYPIFSVRTIYPLIGTAGLAFLIIFPLFNLLTALPVYFGYDAEAAPALPAHIIGIASLSLAIVMAFMG